MAVSFASRQFRIIEVGNQEDSSPHISSFSVKWDASFRLRYLQGRKQCEWPFVYAFVRSFAVFLSLMQRACWNLRLSSTAVVVSYNGRQRQFTYLMKIPFNTCIYLLKLRKLIFWSEVIFIWLLSTVFICSYFSLI